MSEPIKSKLTVDCERPLITFALFAYNQEQFIGEAVKGAFAQTYSPLEIILSDDCSSDRTYEIMQEMAVAYQGPHTIILNRNERNLGLIAHANKVVMEISLGEIIVMAAGDDISFPGRVDSVFEAFNNGAEIMSVSMNYNSIDARGKSIKKQISHREGYFSLSDYLVKRQILPVFGCTRAYHKKVFDIFGELSPDCGAEDYPLIFRSLIIGKTYHTEYIGIKYRHLDNSMSKTLSLKHTKGSYKQRIKDMKKALELNLLSDNEYALIIKNMKIGLANSVIKSRFEKSNYAIMYYILNILFKNCLTLIEKKSLLYKLIDYKMPRLLKFIRWILHK